ncbi:hypothetical protein CK203_110447 [Vitis vinifera]|uniref:Uncharacterized protein n=1 Tax=Vitis vinifera TaxID=29760 RepID=A0A438BN94_VITVI|nr:hypothetical protein CK203_110447 [Vitis vinifera]
MNVEELYISGKSRLTYTSFGFVTAEFYYLELYKAVLNGDWESASKLLKDDPRSFSAPIGTDDSRMLHIAVELGEARMGFVEKLVKFMPSEALALQDSDGATALFNAARAGNIKAVKLLVNKTQACPISANTTILRLFTALLDVALYLVKRYPDLATCHFDSARHDANDSDEDFAPLTVLAKRPWAFPSGSRFNLWQLIIYHC